MRFLSCKAGAEDYEEGKGGGGGCMDEWTTKTPNPICRLFFKIDLLTGFAALCLTVLRQNVASLNVYVT